MNIEELKKRRLEELKNKLLEQQSQQLQEELKLQQQIEILENTIKQHLTKEAIQRYGALKSAHPEKALQVIAIIAQAIESGQLNEIIDDKKFKALLAQLNQKKEIKIKRI